MSFEKNKKLALGALSFAQRPDRESGNIYVYNKAHEPDHDKVIAARDELKKSSKIKGSHQMSLQTDRDMSMYNFSESDMKAISRKVNAGR